MFNFDYITDENLKKKKSNLVTNSWPSIQILLLGGFWSEKQMKIQKSYNDYSDGRYFLEVDD